jgi:putative flippase GtrA
MTPGQRELLRYVISGLVATVVHYTVLSLNITLLEFRSAGLANFVAALFGITASFLGSYYYVFRSRQGQIVSQLVRFGGLYGAIAVLHGSVLWLWTDRFGLDFRAGFLVATALQVSLSYLGNKFIVFR